MGLVVTPSVPRFLYFLHYAKVLSKSLATIEQYRIPFNHNAMVVNDHFISEGHV